MILKQEAFQIGDDFGGKQQWLCDSGFTSKFRSDRSCGVAAAANMMTYLGKEFPGYENLYYGDSKEDYIELMKELYRFLRPGIMGIPTLGKMEKGIYKYSKSKDVNIKPRLKRWVYSVKDGSGFIRQGLSKGTPVLLLTWNYSDRELKNHWVTVTGWDVVYGKEYMTVSNWGVKKTYSYDDWVSERSLLKGAIYLDPDKYI